MFGAHMQDHEARYDMAAEWIEIMIEACGPAKKSSATKANIIRSKKGCAGAEARAAPLSRDHERGRIAGKGQHFSAKYSDIAFIQFDNHDSISPGRKSRTYRRLAREEYGREI